MNRFCRAATSRRTPLTGGLIAAAVLLALAGCGSGGATSTQSTVSSIPSFASEPYTHQQQLVLQGAHLVVTDGCSVCHLVAHTQHAGPSFDSFAGHDVMLADRRSVLVDERFLRDSLLHPGAQPLAGYDPAPMIAAVKRLHLSSQPAQVAALVAFIEQIGPESEP
ncbi:MAG: hypothetical protein ACLQQB_05265 [Solirubrobacteraceae bacterium]|jgi:hypothetical protein